MPEIEIAPNWRGFGGGREGGAKLGSFGKNTVLQGATNRSLTRESGTGGGQLSRVGSTWIWAGNHGEQKETKETKRRRLKAG